MFNSFPTLFSKSLTDPVSYQQTLRKKTHGQGIGYLYVLLLIISLMWILVGAAKLYSLSRFLPAIEEQKQVVRDLYPDELIITVQTGAVSTNVQEPYTIPLPPQWKQFLKDDERFQHFAVIDTSASADDYPDVNAFILLTKRSVVHPARGSSGHVENGYQVTPIDPSITATFDEKMYQEILDELMPIFDLVLASAKWLLIPFLFIGPFAMAGIFLIVHLLYLLFGSLLLWIIDILFLKKHLTFGELYKLSLFGITWPLIVSTALSFLGFSFPLLFTVIFLVWMIYVLRNFPVSSKHTT